METLLGFPQEAGLFMSRCWPPHWTTSITESKSISPCSRVISGSFTNRIKAHNKTKQFVHTSIRLTEISCADALSRSGRFRNSKFPGADSDDNKTLKCAVLAFTALCGDMSHGWDSLLVLSAALNHMTLLTTDTWMFGSPKSMFRVHRTCFHVILNPTPSLMLKTRVANITEENTRKGTSRSC